MKRRFPAFVLCFLLIYSVFIPISLGGYVKNIPYQPVSNSRGNTLYVGGSGGDNYTKIQDAIDNASDGDTVFVYDDSSPYIETVLIDTSINLIGENRNTTVIDGNLRAVTTVMIEAEDSTISSFTIQKGNWGIFASHRSNISNNNIVDCSNGIYLKDYESILVNNSFRFCLYSSMVISGKSHFIAHNNIYSTSRMDHESDVRFGGRSEYIVFINNTLIYKGEVPKTGLHFETGCKNSIINGNYISGYRHGILINNLISVNNVISGNILESNNDGIRLEKCWFNDILGNAFLNNDDGIGVTQLSFKNEIKQNNFINNNDSAYLNLLAINNEFDGNFWDIPRTEPYEIRGSLLLLLIPWIEYDYNPAQEPYDIEL